MFTERTSVGLDVHARSIWAHATDWQTGQQLSQRLVPTNEQVLAWVGGLPGPVAVAYEAGPTGFGVARALIAAGIRCVVVAPSKPGCADTAPTAAHPVGQSCGDGADRRRHQR